MDIGAGTGILSLFAAQAGAARVFAIEYSDIADHAVKIVKDNHFDHIITVIKGKAEEIELPDGIKKVDIIVSEWMGYSLFYESMLDTVLFARDKWLDRENGMMFPDRCELYISAIEDGENKKIHHYWDDVHGLDMSMVTESSLKSSVIMPVRYDKVVTNSCMMKSFDLYSVRKEDLSFKAPFKIKARRKDRIDAFVTHFNVEFTKCHTKTGFSTSPHSHPTHWQQTIFHLKDFINVKQNDVIYGEFSMRPKQMSHRSIDITIRIYYESEGHPQVNSGFDYDILMNL